MGDIKKEQFDMKFDRKCSAKANRSLTSMGSDKREEMDRKHFTIPEAMLCNVMYNFKARLCKFIFLLHHISEVNIVLFYSTTFI